MTFLSEYTVFVYRLPGFFPIQTHLNRPAPNLLNKNGIEQSQPYYMILYVRNIMSYSPPMHAY